MQLKSALKQIHNILILALFILTPGSLPGQAQSTNALPTKDPNTPSIPGGADGSTLPLLITKQPIQRLRFLSADNKITYFQKKSGELFASIHYDLFPVLTAPENSQFTMTSSPARQFLVAQMQPFFYSGNDSNQLDFLFLIAFNKTKPEPIDQGIAPRLHLQDKFLSYYHPVKKILTLHNTLNRERFAIQLQNPINPYFIPDVIMVSDHEILYTDLNANGTAVINITNRKSKQSLTLLKAKPAGQRIELCLNEKQELIIGQFPMPTVSGKSKISLLDLKKSRDFTKLTPLYEASSWDLGHIDCTLSTDKIFFIQNLSDKDDLSVTKSELAEIELKSKKVKVLTKLGDVTNFINMDGRLLIPYQEKLIVMKGNANANDDEIINH